MQLRSGRSTLATATANSAASRAARAARAARRDSRNYDEFNERRRYQKEQKQLEEMIYERSEDTLQERWKAIMKRIRHLLYLAECQRQQKCAFSEKLKTIKELYEFILYHIDDIIELFNGDMKYERRFPSILYNKGNHLRWEIRTGEKRTRSEEQLANECNDVINHVTQLIYRYILCRN